jgi:hypothetical protein
MLWGGTNHRPLDPGEAARRIHSQWLTTALRSNLAYPRIPLRRADEGGWDDLLAKPRGREVADRWWRRALTRIGL